MIRIYYHNIMGLDLKKLRFIERLLVRETAIYFIAEHWFSRFEELSNSPCFITSTPVDYIRRSGHQNGGIAALCSPNLLNSTQITSTSTYHLTITVASRLITALYLPPKMNLRNVYETLSESVLPSADLVIGDINVRFGSIMGDNRTWNEDRGEVITSFLSAKGFLISQALNGCSRNDHVFSKEKTDWTYSWLDKNQFSTDHGRIELDLTPLLRNRHSKTALAKQSKYAFKLLEEPFLQFDLSNYIHTIAPILQELIAKVNYFLRIQNIHRISVRLKIINITYDIVKNCLLDWCNKHIPEYDPLNQKQKQETLHHLDKTTTNRQAIKTFKKAMRHSSANNLFVARDSKNTALDEAYNHYSSLFDPTPRRLDEDPNKDNESEPILPPQELFLAKSVSTTIDKYSSMKAGGPDGLEIRFLKQANKSNRFAPLIADLFNLFYESGCTPSDWNTSLIHLIMKDKTQPFVDKARPISLTNIFRRIFEKILIKEWDGSKWSKLHPSQAGFRRGWSTISHILTTDTYSKLTQDITIFLDLKAAFDKVDHKILLNELAKRNCPPHTRLLLKSLMISHCKSFISVDGSAHKKNFKRTKGLFQGSILSPFLFNIYIDPLAQELANLDIKTLFFADDIALKGSNWIVLQKALDICYSWSQRFHMTFGIPKCGVVIKNHRQKENHNLHLNNETLPIVTQYTYLGVPHDAYGINWSDYTTKITHKATNILKAVWISGKAWPVPTRLIIFKTFIRPLYEYCLPLLESWFQKNGSRSPCRLALSKTNSDCIEWVAGHKGPIDTLSCILGLPTLQERCQILHAGLTAHLQHMASDNPLTKLIAKRDKLKNKNILLKELMKSKLLDNFHAQYSTSITSRDEPKNDKWKYFIRKTQLNSYESTKAILPHYITRTCRARNLADNCIYQDTETTKRAIKWRTNRAFSRSICPKCHKQFNRAHISRCNLLKPLNNDASLTYEQDLELVREHIPTSDTPIIERYTLLDSSLNHKRYDQFMSYYQQLWQLIYDPP